MYNPFKPRNRSSSIGNQEMSQRVRSMSENTPESSSFIGQRLAAMQSTTNFPRQTLTTSSLRALIPRSSETVLKPTRGAPEAPKYVLPKTLVDRPSPTPKRSPATSTALGIDETDYVVRRTRVIIISHKNYSKELGVEPREGSEVDVANLKKALARLGVMPSDIELLEEKPLHSLLNVVTRISQENYKNHDSLMVFVMTHGGDKDNLYAYDTDYSLDLIRKPFLGDKCEGLRGKPKMFFIVACRGKNTDSGVKIRPQTRRPSTNLDASPISVQTSYTIPVQADVLTAFSTEQGYYSYRELNRGTWYIEALYKEIMGLPNNTKINLLELLTTVNRRLSIQYATYAEESSWHDKKQCASYSSTLLRNLILTIRDR